jgi:hypothetical protein
MFISYNNTNPLCEKHGIHSWEYELIDNEFGTVSGVATIEFWIGGMGEIVITVIQEYSKRNLNVAANLAICFVWISKQYTYWTIQKIIDYNKEYNPLFQQYEEDLQKYLILL